MNKYSEIKKYIDLKPAVEQILHEQAEVKQGWKYVKSKRSFVYKVSKNMSVDIYTGFSSKATFVHFQFSIFVRHKFIKIVYEKLGYRKPLSDIMLVRNKTRFVPEKYNRGSCTVYLPNTSDIFDRQYAKGNKNYVHLAEFPDYLSSVFELAESEINHLFNLNSEQELVESIISHPIGTFSGEDVLAIQLMLGNSDYYQKLITFYNQPHEILWRANEDGFRCNENFSADVGQKLYDIYEKHGDFPKFDFA